MIRRAAIQDKEDVCRLAARFATSFSVSSAACRDTFARVVDQPHSYLAVEEQNGKVIAYVLGYRHETFFANGPIAWVEELMVDEGERRQGIGRALMSSVEDWAAEHGCALVALATRRAGEFYSALGYEESATYWRKILSATAATPGD